VAEETEVETTEEGAPQEAPPERHGVPVTDSLGQEVLHPSREQYRGVVEALHDEGYLVCIDVTAVDYIAHPHRSVAPGVTAERFELVTQLLDHEHRRRVRLRVQVPADDPTVPSIVDVHPGADALEREVYDMFGITFDGHPDLTRILMPEDWDGHPLRKDYAVGAIPVQFKGAGKEERS
jgi:NADH-quinone oxidoreductase subunit C